METELARTELVDLDERLLARFSPPLEPEEVRQCVREVAARFEAATVRTYVTLLVDRIATDRLRAAARRA